MLINIQFLRMLAAMLVVFYHISARVRISGVEQGNLLEVMNAIGFAGVDIFFVISGFIMAHTSFAARGPSDAWAFLRRRVARIYSGYWPFFLLALAVFAWADPQFLKNAKLFESAILWPAWPVLISVSWTLTFEVLFYLLFTLIICITGRRRSLLLLGLFLSMFAVLLYSQFVRHAFDPGYLESMNTAETLILSPYWLEFLGGALLAGWLRRADDWEAPMKKNHWNFFLLTSGWALFLFGGWINNHFYGGALEQGYAVVHRVLIFGAPSLMILAGVVRLDQNGQRAPLRFSLLAGGASYAIYLSHGLILVGMQKLGFNEYADSLDSSVAQILYLAVAAGILGYSVLHFRLIERPLHKLFKRALRVA